MKKIKHFKINLRFREILRNLKTASNTANITMQLEDAVKREREHLDKKINPAAVYETCHIEKINFNLSAEIPKKAVAVSFFVATCGKDVEDEVLSAKGHSEDLICQILHSIAIEAVDQSMNFVCRLLADEAKDDECELTRPVPIVNRETLANILNILPCDKIGVTLKENGIFQPQYTGCEAVFWMPLKKRGSK